MTDILKEPKIVENRLLVAKQIINCKVLEERKMLTAEGLCGELLKSLKEKCFSFPKEKEKKPEKLLS